MENVKNNVTLSLRLKEERQNRAKLAPLKQQVMALEIALETKSREFEKLRDQINEIEIKRDSYRESLIDIQQSFTFKLTRPIRAVGRLFARSKRLIGTVTTGIESKTRRVQFPSEKVKLKGDTVGKHQTSRKPISPSVPCENDLIEKDQILTLLAKYQSQVADHVRDSYRNPGFFRIQSERAQSIGITGFYYDIEITRKLSGEKTLIDHHAENSDCPLSMCACFEVDKKDLALTASREYLTKGFIEIASRYFDDHRYLKFNGKPIVVIETKDKDDVTTIIKSWRNWCDVNGLGPIIVLTSNSADSKTADGSLLTVDLDQREIQNLWTHLAFNQTSTAIIGLSGTRSLGNWWEINHQDIFIPRHLPVSQTELVVVPSPNTQFSQDFEALFRHYNFMTGTLNFNLIKGPSNEKISNSKLNCLINRSLRSGTKIFLTEDTQSDIYAAFRNLDVNVSTIGSRSVPTQHSECVKLFSDLGLRPSISILLDSEDVLRFPACLKQINNQYLQPAELVFFGPRASQKKIDFLIGETHYRIQHIFTENSDYEEDKLNLATTLTSEFIWFLDASCVLPRDWLSSIIHGMNASNSAVGTAPIRGLPLFGEKPVASNVSQFCAHFFFAIDPVMYKELELQTNLSKHGMDSRSLVIRLPELKIVLNELTSKFSEISFSPIICTNLTTATRFGTFCHSSPLLSLSRKQNENNLPPAELAGIYGLLLALGFADRFQEVKSQTRWWEPYARDSRAKFEKLIERTYNVISK